MDEFHLLLHKVFGTPNGKKLLKELERRFVHVTTFSNETNEFLYNSGKKELIQTLAAIARTKEKDLEVEVVTEGYDL